jgi:hypothetical protein
MIHSSSRYIPVHTTANGKVVQIAIQVQAIMLSLTVLSAIQMPTPAVTIQMHSVTNAILQEGVNEISYEISDINILRFSFLKQATQWAACNPEHYRSGLFHFFTEHLRKIREYQRNKCS